MTSRMIRTFPDAEAVSQAAAQEFIRCAAEAIKARGRFTVALSGGSTPQRMFQLLSEPALRTQVDETERRSVYGRRHRGREAAPPAEEAVHRERVAGAADGEHSGMEVKVCGARERTRLEQTAGVFCTFIYRNWFGSLFRLPEWAGGS